VDEFDETAGAIAAVFDLAAIRIENPVAESASGWEGVSTSNI